jgi:hypothetical protein
MMVAYELHVDEEVVFTWPLSRLARWAGFFKARSELQEKELAKNRGKSRRLGKR